MSQSNTHTNHHSPYLPDEEDPYRLLLDCAIYGDDDDDNNNNNQPPQLKAHALLQIVSPCLLMPQEDWTPLHLAAHHANVKVLRLFLQHLAAHPFLAQYPYTPRRLNHPNPAYRFYFRRFYNKPSTSPQQQQQHHQHHHHQQQQRPTLANENSTNSLRRGALQPSLLSASTQDPSALLLANLIAGSSGSIPSSPPPPPQSLPAPTRASTPTLLSVVDVPGYARRTPLHLAAAAGNITAVRVLIQAGADPATQDHWGNTPAMLAAEYAHTPVVLLLLNRIFRTKMQASTTPRRPKHLLSPPPPQPPQPPQPPPPFPPNNNTHRQNHRNDDDNRSTTSLEDTQSKSLHNPWKSPAAALPPATFHAAVTGNNPNGSDSPTTSGAFHQIKKKRRPRSPAADVFYAAIASSTPVPASNHVETAQAILRLDPHLANDKSLMTEALLALVAQNARHQPLLQVQMLVRLGAHVDATDSFLRTPLHWAAKWGWYPIVRFLLVHCKSRAVNMQDQDKSTPMKLNCRHGSSRTIAPIVRLLLRHGADPNIKDSAGVAPISCVVFEEALPVVRSLIRAGAQVENHDGTFDSVVLDAAIYGSDGLLDWLAKQGYDVVGHGRPHGLSAFHLASFSGHLGLMKSLISRGSQPNALDVNGLSALHLYALGVKGWGPESPSRASPDAVVRFLVKHCKIDPNLGSKSAIPPILLETANVDGLFSNDGCTALHLASDVGHVETVIALLSYGASVNSTCNLGRSPLTGAAFNGDHQVCEALIAAGADVNLKDTTRLQADAFLGAAQERHLKVAKLLLKHGACPDTKTVHGANGIWLTLSTEGDASNAVNELKRLGVPPISMLTKTGFSSVHQAARFNQGLSFLELIEDEQNISLPDKNGRTPLHHAAVFGSRLVLNVLADAGADVHVVDRKGRTPLHLAARTMNFVAILILLDMGADVNARDKFGWTPLIHACSWDEADRKQYHGVFDTHCVLKLLVEANAQLNARSKRGLTAIHFASVCGRPDIVHALILEGANIEACTKAGRTALQLAAMSNRCDVVERLISSGANVCCVDTKGNSALHSAAARGHSDVMSILLDRGAAAIVAQRNESGRSPLDLAARAGHSKSVAILLEHVARTGVEARANDRLLVSALDAARRHKRVNVVRMLVSYEANVNEEGMMSAKGGVDNQTVTINEGSVPKRNHGDEDEELDEVAAGEECGRVIYGTGDSECISLATPRLR